MTDDDIEHLREQSQRGSRLEETSDQGEDLVEEITSMLQEIESGDRRKTIALRDQPVAALLAALDENPDEMTAVGQALQRALGREVDDEFDRSEISRLVFRVGLQEAVPGYMDQLQDAHAKHETNHL